MDQYDDLRAGVLVRLSRPEDYDDAHPDIIISDARIHSAFEPQDVTETVRALFVERDELRTALAALESAFMSHTRWNGDPPAEVVAARAALKEKP